MGDLRDGETSHGNVSVGDGIVESLSGVCQERWIGATGGLEAGWLCPSNVDSSTTFYFNLVNRGGVLASERL